MDANSIRLSRLAWWENSLHFGVCTSSCSFFQVLVRKTRTPCLHQFTKGLEAPGFSLFERIFAILRISVAKSRRPVEIALYGFPCLRFQALKCNLHSTQYLSAVDTVAVRVAEQTTIGQPPKGRALPDVSKEAVGIHVLLTQWLFACDIPRSSLRRVSLAKWISASSRC